MGDRSELRRLAEAATPGPWRWSGHDDGSIELTTVHRGRQRIVTSVRSKPCVVELADESIALTRDACTDCRAEATKTQDPFVDYRCPLRANLDTIWLRDDGIIRPANVWAVREQHYRSNVASVDHPDARYLAAIDPQTVLALLDRLDQDVHAGGGNGTHYCPKCHEDSRAEPHTAETTAAPTVTVPGG